MGLEASWSLADIPSNARDAANAAALREGLSVGEWLTRRILKRFSEMSSREQEEAFNDLSNRLGELNERLDQFEDQFRIEPLREAVKKLHLGMARLAEDLVQTTGRSAIQLSSLSNSVDTLNSVVERVRAETGEKTVACERRVAEYGERAHSFEERQGNAARILESRMDELSGSVEELRTGTSKSTVAAERAISLLEQGVHDIDLRNNETLTALTAGLECFSARLEEARRDASISSAALDGRMHTLQRRVEEVEERASEQVHALTGKIETFAGKAEDVRSETTGLCSALDQRLLLVQQGLQKLEFSQGDTRQGLSQNLESVSVRVDSIWTKMSAARAAIEQRIAETERSISDLHLLQKENFADIGASRSAEADSLAGLGSAVAELKTRFGQFAAQDHFQALEQSVSELAGRTNTVEAGFSALGELGNNLAELKKRVGELAAQDHFQPLQQTFSELAGRTDAVEARFSALAELGGSVAELKTRIGELAAQDRFQALEQALSELAGRTNALESGFSVIAPKFEAVDTQLASVDTHLAAIGDTLAQASQKQDEALSGLRTDVLQETAKLVRDSAERGIQMQQNAVAELKVTVRDEALRTVSDRFETELRLQQEMLAEWKAGMLDDAVKALGSKLEAEGQKQQEALAELKTSLLDLSRSLSQRLETSEKNQDEALAHFRGELLSFVARPTAEGEHHVAQPAHDQAPVSSFVLVDAAQSHEAAADHSVLELSSPVVEEAPHEPAEISHDRFAIIPLAGEEVLHESAAEAPPPFAPHADAHSEAPPFHSDSGHEGLHAEPPHDALQPAAALACDEAPKPSTEQSYLSAARQSLQAAAARSEGEAAPKDWVGFRFFRPADALTKSKRDTTSYALLAAIALVAILAALVAVGKFMGRESPATAEPVVHKLATTHPLKGIVATRLATQRTLSLADVQSDPGRLAMLANMGNPQAQLLLGVHNLGSNDAEAAKWLAQAAAKGQAEAQYRLGGLYASGHGVKADAAMALRWYQAAANAGNRRAMFNVGLAYAQGQGTAKNPQEAARWFEKAAQLGLIDAQFNLAILYERGLGVPQSLIDAYRWYAIAAKAGDHESKDRVDALSSQLVASDRAAADTAAAQFVPAMLNAKANPAH